LGEARLGDAGRGLGSSGPDFCLPDGEREQSHEVSLRDFSEPNVCDMWMYRAVAAVVRGKSLLHSLLEVNLKCDRLTGISCGSYLALIVA